MEECLEEALRLKAKELRSKLLELKKQDFDINVEKLKASLPKRKRCIICTLRLPCKHYKNVREMPKDLKEFNEENLLKSTEEPIDFSKFVPNFPEETKKIGFTVNYRGRERKYYIDPHIRTVSLPNEKRFNLLCTIEAYREEKLKEEIRKLEKAKEEEVKKAEQIHAISEMKQRYLSRQKEKLQRHKEEINAKREMMRNSFEEDNERRKLQDIKEKKYHENNKKALAEYQQRKRMSQQNDPIYIREPDGLALDLQF